MKAEQEATVVDAAHPRTNDSAATQILPVVGEETTHNPILPITEERRARPPGITLGAGFPSQVDDGEEVRGISGCEENVIAINAVSNCNNRYTVQRVIA
ncbi:MAG: hypothetical protein NT069_13035 [Planctomycetota bacterium]|nr:hypothetical protein [Planctomycetota bacterium]